METINLTKSDIEDFKSFLSDPAVECITSKKTPNFVELIYNTDQKFIVPLDIYESIFPSKYSNDLIFGKDKTENIVSIETEGDNLVIFKETEAGVTKETRPNAFWMLTHDRISSKQSVLSGNQHYKYMSLFDNFSDYYNVRKKIYSYDHYKISNPKESAMVYFGLTYFKGISISDVSVLSFDIETDGLKQHSKSEIYLITNTFRRFGVTQKKTFRLDHFESQGEMLLAWTAWVREVNPSVMLGHNIFFYDLPYLLNVANNINIQLNLGRDNSEPEVAKYTSKFRKDGSQSYDYNNISIFGRELVDTMFLSVKYDFARKYESYGLKAIVKHEGLEKADRSFVDAGKIKKYYYDRFENPEMWNKVVQYAEEDSDDALKLYDLMAPSYFYLSQKVSKSWQQMINSATGSQINNIMVRSYFQLGHSIAKADETVPFEGAISFGIPGLYHNTFKLDVASLYPSIILAYQIYNKQKDPLKHFLQLIEYMTTERLKNKSIYEATNSIYHKNLSDSEKIVANSGYGALSTPGLNYNYPDGASEITKYGRSILNLGVEKATGKDAEQWKKDSEPEEEEELEEA